MGVLHLDARREKGRIGSILGRTAPKATLEQTGGSMKSCMAVFAVSALVLAGVAWLPAAPVPEFRDLFNGKDLTGWVNVNTDPDTWKAKDGMIVCSGRPIGMMRTDRQYENFIL